MRCPKCHADNPEQSDFCGKCGSRVRHVQAVDDRPTEAAEPALRELKTGSTFAGRYQVIEELGRGGMGRVYKVFDTEVREKIALKLLAVDIATDGHAIERFRNELRLARRVRHPRVCQMFDLGAHDGTLFITMEYVSGEDLKSMIRMSRQLSVGTALHVARQVCEGLVEAHRLGVVHRDLKPQNIMIDREGDARIMDFGIARSMRTRGMTDSRIIIGTPEYMSPEQVDSSDIDYRSDIYSLGVVVYEMLTGHVPFAGDTPISVALKHKTELPRSPTVVNAQVPEEVAWVVLKCLEKDRSTRYQSAAELLADLERIQSAVPATSKLVPRRRGTSGIVRPRWRRLLPYGALVSVLCAVSALAVVYFARQPAAITSIAVLPFASVKPDADTELLAEGIPDNLIGKLSEFASLKKVIASSSAARYKNQAIDPTQVGRELDVAALVTERVQRSGSSISVSVELVSTRDGSILWRRSYQQAAGGSLSLSDSIARDTIDQLRLRLTTENRERLDKRSTTSPEAYQAYLKGRFYWNKRTKAGLMMGLRYFQEAIDRDPAYALAHVGLSDSWALLGRYSYEPPREAMPKARAAAERALELDSRLGEAYTSLAFIKRYFDFDWEGADRDFRKSIEFSPNYAMVHHWHALALSGLGHHEEAKRGIARAQELDPLSIIISTNVAWVHYFAGEYDQAIEQFRRTLDMDPEYALAHMRFGETYVQKKMLGQAIAEFEKALALSPDNTEMQAGLAAAYAIGGKVRESESLLKKLFALPKDLYVSSYDIGTTYLALGQKSVALDWLEKAVDERASRAVYLKVDPVLNGLRNQPRFKALLARVRLHR